MGAGADPEFTGVHQSWGGANLLFLKFFLTERGPPFKILLCKSATLSTYVAPTDTHFVGDNRGLKFNHWLQNFPRVLKLLLTAEAVAICHLPSLNALFMPGSPWRGKLLHTNIWPEDTSVIFSILTVKHRNLKKRYNLTLKEIVTNYIADLVIDKLSIYQTNQEHKNDLCHLFLK